MTGRRPDLDDRKMSLPILLSVPHAGLRVPPEVAETCVLTPQQIVEDGDVGAAEIYALAAEVACFVTTDIARAIVDLNRAEDDRRKDGVVKTHTCWDVPVYRSVPTEEVVQRLLVTYYRPYHERLARLASPDLRIALDCHTMAALGPPVGPDPGVQRPWVCLSNADGTCPQNWLDGLKTCFREQFGDNVKVNDPFTGGHITRTHSREMPWVQLELSRGPFLTDQEKRARVLQALRAWIDQTAVPTAASAAS